MKRKFKLMALLCFFALLAAGTFTSCEEEEEEKEPTLFGTWRAETDTYRAYLGVDNVDRFDDNNYEIFTIAKDSTFKEEIYKEGKLTDTQTYKIAAMAVYPFWPGIIAKGSVQISIEWVNKTQAKFTVGYPNGVKASSIRTYTAGRINK